MGKSLDWSTMSPGSCLRKRPSSIRLRATAYVAKGVILAEMCTGFEQHIVFLIVWYLVEVKDVAQAQVQRVASLE